MDDLQDLKKAIIGSIVERSLDKINDYFNSSKSVAKNLNSQILSILLKSLQKEDRSNEENVMNVKCVLQCMNTFLEFKQNSATWEHLSEDISKIFELCFCISLNINDKELISFNISVLDQIIRVNKNLSNYVFGYLIGPCLTALSIYCRSSDNTLLLTLSTFTSSLCENASRMKRNEIVPTVTHHLNTLSDLLTLCGDYETQAAIVEVLARCKCSLVPSTTCLGSNDKLNLFSCSTKLSEEYNKYSFVKFDPECRLFLNELNESLGDNRKVYSVPCICLVHNGITLKKPKDPGYKSFWVDFNITRKRISFYHELPNTTWTIEWVPFREVVNVIAKDSVCTTKHANINIDAVKVEFTLCKKKIVLERIELLKIYCRKTQFDLLNRVLNILFPDVYTCAIDNSLQDESGLANKMPVKLSSFTSFKELSNPGVTNNPLSHPATKSDEIGSALLNQNTQQNVMHIKSPTWKQNNRRETFTEINSNVSEGVNSNCELSLKNACSFEHNHDTEPGEVIYVEHKNHSILVNNATKKSSEILKSPSFTDMSSSKYEINDRSKDPAGYKNLNNKEITERKGNKRKRLYSIENEDTHVKSIVLSSQDEQLPLNVKASPNKQLITKGKYTEKHSFWDKNLKRRKVASQKNKGSSLFTNENSSDNSITFLVNQVTSTLSDAEKREFVVSDHYKNYSKRVDKKLPDPNTTLESAKLSKNFAENIFLDLFSCATATSMKKPNRNTYTRQKGRKLKFAAPCPDPDYKSTCYIDKTECKVPNKRVLRERKKPLNKVDVIEKNKANKSDDETKFAAPCPDPDYKSTCYIDETECKVPNKRVLRKRKKPLNKVDVIEKNKSNKSDDETNDSLVPKKSRRYTSCIGADKSVTKNTIKSDTDQLSTSYTNESNFSLNNPLKVNQDFLNTILLSRIVEPTRDETCCNDIAITAIQPEDSKILPKDMTTYEAQCELDHNVVQVDLDLTNSMDLAICDELSASKSALKGTKGNPMNSCNMKVDEMPIEIHNESCCHDMSLIQSTFKVDDILEFSQKSVLNLKNNIKSSLIQSQEKRQQNLDDHGLQLTNTRYSILEHCERLEVNWSKLNELKASLNETLDLQQGLIIKIQREMANLEEAKVQFCKKEADVKNYEMFNIMNIFKNISTYVRRLLFTSFSENALTS